MKRVLLLLSLPFFLYGGNLKTRITFTGDATLSIRLLTQAFNALGYKLDISSVKISERNGELAAQASGMRVFSDSGLREKLREEGIEVEKSVYDAGELLLILHTENAFWNVPILSSEESGAELKRTNTPQWFRVNDAQKLRIQPPYAGKWYPDIAFFDRSMHLISSLRETKPGGELELEIPGGAYYLKISNVQGMKLLKEGMWIEAVDLSR